MMSAGHPVGPDVIVADLDRGEVRPCAPFSDAFPSSLQQLGQCVPPAAALVRKLQSYVSSERFDAAGVQASCLQFVADAVNVEHGMLGDSSHAADAIAVQKWALVREFSDDVRLRCERDAGLAPHVGAMKPKLRDAASATLATLCEQSVGGLSMLQSRGRPVAPFLSLVYASRAFRQWWITSEHEASAEVRMCVGYRRVELNLADHLADHRRALQQVEESLFSALVAPAVDGDADAAPPVAAAFPPPKPTKRESPDPKEPAAAPPPPPPPPRL